MRSLNSWLGYIGGQDWQNMEMGLTRMRTVVQRMDLERPAPRIITVAGTNGKGSTCVACEALLQHAGFRTGVTLSPHLTRFNERIRIDGEEAGDDLICSAFQAVDTARGELPLSYFEFAALAALWCFKMSGVDCAVLEIGLGGRLDAFNVIDADVAVITSIDLDHEALLGTTRTAIGWEKAGILRTGQQVVLGADMPPSVYQRCRELALSPVVLGQQWNFSHHPNDNTWSVCRDDRTVLEGLPFGQCAPQNQLLAFLAVRNLVTLEISQLIGAIAGIRLPGRMQEVTFMQRRWVLDIAHNPAGAAFLVKQLQARDVRPALIVCGMLRDKNHAQVYNQVKAVFSAPWLFVDTQGERGLPAKELVSRLPDSDGRVLKTWQGLADEVNSASRPGDVILAFGSFNLIEQIHESHAFC